MSCASAIWETESTEGTEPFPRLRASVTSVDSVSQVWTVRE